MSGLPPLDALIALAGLLAGLSVVCSAIGEWISGLLGWRSRMLADALRSMLHGATDPRGRDALTSFHAHPLIHSLGRPGPPDRPARPGSAPRRSLRARLTRFSRASSWGQESESPVKPAPLPPPPAASERPQRKTRGPSYIPPHAFAETLVSLIRPEEWRSPEPMTYNDFWRSVRNLPDSDLKAALETLGRDSGHDVAQVRRNIERWFASTMDRATGWYKRRMHATCLAVSAALCLVLGVDAVELARPFGAGGELVRPETSFVSPPPPAPDAEPGPVARVRAPAPPFSLRDDLLMTARSVPSPTAGLPVADRTAAGWSAALARASQEIPGRLPGLLLATVLVAMGAPFWFDVLSSFTAIRLAGSRPASVDPAPATRARSGELS